MKRILYVFSIWALLAASACTEAIPNVSDLIKSQANNGASSIDDKEPSVNVGGGAMTGAQFKIFGKVGPAASVMTGTNYRINMSGDN